MTHQNILNVKKKRFQHIFHLIPRVQFCQKKFVLLISTQAKFDPYIRIWRFPLVPPSSLYLYFKKILEKGQFPIEKPEKNCNTMTYPHLSWLVTPILSTANNHVMTIFSAQLMSNKVQLYLIIIFGKFYWNLTSILCILSHISMCWPQM